MVTAEVKPPELSRSLTLELANYARDLRYEDLSAPAIEVAKHCLLDWFGVTLAGSREPLSDILLSRVGASDRSDEATLIGRSGQRVSVLNAALINGSTSHALDFDDTHFVMSGHPSVPVIPAALALAERRGSSGQAFLTAVVAGIELECRLGALMNPAHYQAGFHATGTLGTFGAAAASAHLLELEERHWPHALGLAATQAAGLKSSFGSMAKPLHAGKAAYDGLLSALLAGGGFTGNPAILEASQGFADTHGGGQLFAEDLQRVEARFLICDTLFKYHAACYLTQSAIEGARALRARAGLDGSEVEEVVVEVPPTTLKVCNISEPSTGLEGKFSLRATTAMSLLGDDMSDLRTYSDDRIRAAEVVALRDRVVIEPIDGASATCSKVVVTTRDGDRHEASIDVGRPERDLDRQWRRLSEKFFALTESVTGTGRAQALRKAIQELGQRADLKSLVALAG